MAVGGKMIGAVEWCREEGSYLHTQGKVPYGKSN